MFAGGLKNGIEQLSNLLGSAFPSDFQNLRSDRMFRSAGDRGSPVARVWGFFMSVFLFWDAVRVQPSPHGKAPDGGRGPGLLRFQMGEPVTEGSAVTIA